MVTNNKIVLLLVSGTSAWFYLQIYCIIYHWFCLREEYSERSETFFAKNVQIPSPNSCQSSTKAF